MDTTNIVLAVDFIYTPVVNYAIQQNKIALVRKLSIENCSENDFYNLEINIIANPTFINQWSFKIAELRKGQSIEIEANNLKLSASYLIDLTEKISGELNISISTGASILFNHTYEVEILAYDQWNGIGVLPEMLAAFVTPNHPSISAILQKASSILGKWTGSPALDAYQSFSIDRVKKQVGAIYEAISNLEIVYCSPPASFENKGQRIRLCDTIFTQKLATCIDISILLASCIEAIGLNPLLVVVKGHAFVGVWLIDELFADSVNDDVSLLKKRSADGINEIILVEATSMNAGLSESFDDSVHSANYKLVNEDDFYLFVDIRRSRFSGIKPLPQRYKTTNGWEILQDEKAEVHERKSEAPVSIPIYEQKTESANSSQLSKQKLWERKLLDLSLRNNLLNLRITQNTIQLFAVNLNNFEDALADGDEFQLLTKPNDWVNPNQNGGIYQAINQADPIVNLLKYELTNKRLRTYLTESELKTSLTHLYRSSRLSLEENGANTLYLALGFLKWYETPQSELARYAPILLLPVQIIKKSSQVGFVIRSREEDTLMNITLLEMLKQDFGIVINGLTELPRDESGVDVIKIFNIIRRGIMSQARWNLEEIAFLGIFSFSKFIMWNDIHSNSDKLINNKIIDSLISGRLKWNTGDILAETDSQNIYHPSSMALPISADHSQLDAIYAASKNQSFILHGPPGTGKSQTITNIIANSLYHGKRVLFVAEKMAALSVVQKRLSDIGLSPFCLELHSNKSNKSNILDQLLKTTEIIKKTSPLEFSDEAERLYKQRAELNNYVEALHKKQPTGFSLYECFMEYSEVKYSAPDVILNKDLIVNLTKDKFVDYCNLVEELQNAGSLCGHPYQHKLAEIKTTAYSQQLKAKAGELILKYIDSLNKKKESQDSVSKLLNIKMTNLNTSKFTYLKRLSEIITLIPEAPEKLLNMSTTERTHRNIIQLSGHGKKRDEYRDILLGTFTKAFLNFGAETNLSQWNIHSQKWFLPKFLGQAKILKSIQLFSKQGKIDSNEITGYLETLIKYQNEQELLNENATLLSKELDFLWNNGSCDWTGIIEICEKSIELNKVIKTLIEDNAEAEETSQTISKLLSSGSRIFEETKGKVLLEYLEIIKKHQEIESNLKELLKIDFETNYGDLSNNDSQWMQKAENWSTNIDLLRDWASWNIIRDKAIKSGLSDFVEMYETGKIQNREVLLGFKKAIYKDLAEEIISSNTSLSTFNGKLFENKIQKFKEQNKYFEKLIKAELYAVLASKIPSFSQEASSSSEIGILMRAIKNKGRSLSIRHLFDLIPNLLAKMCPCMLMSPISVAQYFEVDQTKFDLVIFDEASQLPTCDAIGTIARGQNVIVVGDPKQMPPTSFFNSNHLDEENLENEDLESILDDCLALSIPSKHLLWHYRSKHESLIAFSNSNYYENRLMTFPSPDDLASKVTNVYVPGYYDRGKTRQNSFEAKAIVEEVLRRLSDPKQSSRSIGIVTFSSTQQNLIDDLLNEAFRKNPDIEKIAFEASEPIFIKNLENVQGDERDVILFSMGYGPDKDGKVYMNFGPVNRNGGWRRLNVAVSRARYEMVVFATLRSEQIDISRSSSEGIMGIKSFLEYSEKGTKALTKKHANNSVGDQFLEKLIAVEIEKMGYSVKTNIGCSDYRIDVGVVHPNKPDEYILGILTDGKNYYAAKTANDREVIQTEVLNILGWNIYRLWTLDWWDDSRKVILDIEASIKQALLNNSEQNEQVQKINITSIPEFDVLPFADSKSITQEVVATEAEFELYTICQLENNSLNISDDFFDSRYKSKIMTQITQIMKIEAPINHKLLSRRVLAAWGISRIGTRLNEYLSSLYAQLNFKKTIQNETLFFWLAEQDEKNYKQFRIPRSEEQKRSADEIAKEEIANGIIHILNNQISLPEEELIKEVAHLFCYARLGSIVDQSVRTGIEYALEYKLIENKNERIILA